jgi:hypothetical protein
MYVYALGRTGRAGSAGKATNIILPKEQQIADLIKSAPGVYEYLLAHFQNYIYSTFGLSKLLFNYFI